MRVVAIVFAVLFVLAAGVAVWAIREQPQPAPVVATAVTPTPTVEPPTVTPVPPPTVTPEPSATPQPTYTPAPTYTPYPTQVPPTYTPEPTQSPAETLKDWEENWPEVKKQIRDGLTDERCEQHFAVTNALVDKIYAERALIEDDIHILNMTLLVVEECFTVGLINPFGPEGDYFTTDFCWEALSLSVNAMLDNPQVSDKAVRETVLAGFMPSDYKEVQTCVNFGFMASLWPEPVESYQPDISDQLGGLLTPVPRSP